MGFTSSALRYIYLTRRRNPVEEHPRLTSVGRDEVPETPNWPSQSHSPSKSFTSSIRVPPEIAAALDSDDEMSYLPTPLQGYRDILEDQAILPSPSNASESQRTSSGSFRVEGSDSATESDSGDDNFGVSLAAPLSDYSVTSDDIERQIQGFRLPSPIPFSNSFEMEYATSPISVPADSNFSSNSTTPPNDGTLSSLPTPMKMFCDIFTRSDR